MLGVFGGAEEITISQSSPLRERQIRGGFVPLDGAAATAADVSDRGVCSTSIRYNFRIPSCGWR